MLDQNSVGHCRLLCLKVKIELTSETLVGFWASDQHHPTRR